ncbi:MAG: glycosyltransferase [Verrucomicrobiota bacterium]
MSRKKVIIVGQLPPPIHGQSVAIERIAKIQSDEYEILSLPLNCSTDIESVGSFQLKKIFITLVVSFKLMRMCFGSKNVLVYYPPASPAVIPVLRDLMFFVIARLGARRWIFHFHAGGLPEFLNSRWWGFLAKWIYPSPKLNISMSKDSELTPGKFFGGEDVYIPYGLEVPLQFEARGHLRPLRLLYLGNLFISKGVEMCLRALKSLRDQGHDLHLDLVGGDVERDRDRIKEIVNELELAEHATFHGVQSGDPKWECFKLADCFVFPSHYPAEKFPNVLIEALGAGLPVVTTHWRGIPELVGTDCTGSTLVDIHDQAGFEKGILDVIRASDETYASYRKASRARFVQKYTLDKFNDSVLAAFSKCFTGC